MQGQPIGAIRDWGEAVMGIDHPMSVVTDERRDELWRVGAVAELSGYLRARPFQP